MLRLISVVLTVALLSPSFDYTHEDFAKYKAVEAYEVRPGILMMPRYSADGGVCEIGLDVRHYSPELVRLDSDLSQTVIDQILDEIVPDSERGARAKDLEGTLIMRRGNTVITNIDFEKVSPNLQRRQVATERKEVVADNVAAIIRWKNRECQKP